jgi:hypothetical protein
LKATRHTTGVGSLIVWSVSRPCDTGTRPFARLWTRVVEESDVGPGGAEIGEGEATCGFALLDKGTKVPC